MCRSANLQNPFVLARLGTCRLKFGARRPKFGACRPKLGACRPKLGTCRPKFGDCDPKFGIDAQTLGLGACRQKSEACRPKCGTAWATDVQTQRALVQPDCICGARGAPMREEFFFPTTPSAFVSLHGWGLCTAWGSISGRGSTVSSLGIGILQKSLGPHEEAPTHRLRGLGRDPFCWWVGRPRCLAHPRPKEP